MATFKARYTNEGQKADSKARLEAMTEIYMDEEEIAELCRLHLVIVL